jgi:hypothetical protein
MVLSASKNDLGVVLLRNAAVNYSRLMKSKV